MDFLSNLPDELLIKIIENNKCLQLMLVSKRFNEIISTAPRLMKKVDLILTEKRNYLEIMESTRKYQTITIKYNYKINDSVLEVVNKFKGSLKHVQLIRCIINENLFGKILDQLPLLNQLSISSTYLQMHDENLNITPRQLHNLRKFNFRNSDQKFINSIKNSPAISHLNVSFNQHHPVSTILNFLQNHADVRVIECLQLSEIEEKIISHLLRMEHLTKLCIEIDRIKTDAMSEIDFKNSSIKILNLYGNPNEPEDFNQFLRFFVQLETLEIEENSLLDESNMLQLQQMHTIQSLKIIKCAGDNFFNSLALNNLKCFEISDIRLSISNNDWMNFSTRNPNIESLKIKDESISNEIFTIICQCFRKLMHFEMFYDPQRLIAHEVVDFICNENLFPSNIKTLMIRKRNYQISSGGGFFILNSEHKIYLDKKTGFQLILK
jgi:hypothetical protein